MITWICRFLILVFTFNVIAPDLLRAQQATPAEISQLPSYQKPYAFNEPDFFKQAQNAQEKENRYVAAMLDLENKYAALDFTSSDEKAAESFGSYMQILHSMAGLTDLYENETSTLAPALEFATVSNPHATDYQKEQGAAAAAKKESIEEEQAKIAWEKFQNIASQEPQTLEDWVAQMSAFMKMIDNSGHIRPTQNDNSTDSAKMSRYTSVYATEGLVSSLQAAQQYATTPEVEDAILDLLPQAEAHLLHALEIVDQSPIPVRNQDEVSFLQKYTYRIALFRLNQLYQAMGKPNPMKNFPVTITKNFYMAAPKQYVTTSVRKGPEGKPQLQINSIEPAKRQAKLFTSLEQIPNNYQVIAAKEQTSTHEVSYEHMIDDFIYTFYQELRQFSPTAMSATDTKASALMQYAVMYALETNQHTLTNSQALRVATHPQTLDAFFELFDDCEEKFLDDEQEHPLMHIQSAFFTAILDHFQYNQVDAQTVKQVKNMLLRQAQSKCANVTLLAVTAAATLNDMRTENGTTTFAHNLHQMWGIQSQADLKDNKLVKVDSKPNAPYFFNQAQRDQLARSIADLLVEAKRKNHYGAETYSFWSGFHANPERYQAFQDGLSAALDRLTPLTAPQMETYKVRPYGAAKKETKIGPTGSSISIYGINAGDSSDPNNDINGSFLFSNHWVNDQQLLAHIYHNNPVDSYLKEIRAVEIGGRIVYEAILWVLAGKAFEIALTGIVLLVRNARLAVITLPKAIKTARTVNTAQKVRAGTKIEELFANTNTAVANVSENAPQATKLWQEASSAFKAAQKETSAAARAAKYGEASQKSREAAVLLAKTGKTTELTTAAKELNQVASKAMQMQRWENAFTVATTISGNLKKSLKADSQAQKLLAETENLLAKAGKTGEKADFAAAASKIDETIAYLEKISTNNLTKNQVLAGEIQGSIRVLKEAHNSALTFTRAAGARTLFSAFNKAFSAKIAQLKKWRDLNIAAGAATRTDANLGRTVYETTVQEGHLEKVSTGAEYAISKGGKSLEEGAAVFSYEPVYNRLKLTDKIFRRPKRVTTFSTEIETADGAVVKLDTHIPKQTGNKLLNNAKALQEHERSITKIVGPRRGGTSARMGVDTGTREFLEQQQLYQRALARNPEAVDWWVSADGGRTYTRVSAQEGQRVIKTLEKEPEALAGSLGKITSKDGKNSFEILKSPQNSAGLKLPEGRVPGTAQNPAELIRVRITNPMPKGVANRLGGKQNGTMLITEKLPQQFVDGTLYEANLRNAGSFSRDAANAMIEKDAARIRNMLGDDLEKAQEFGLLDKEGHLVFGDTGTLLTNNLMPKGALTQAWWSAESGSVFKKFYDNVKLWARWALVYGPIAGIGKDLLLKSMEESQAKEALEQTNDPEWTETWNNLVKNQEPAPTDPFHQELAAMKMEKDPAFDILNREADIFITPFLLAFAGSDKLFGTHLLDMKMYEQMQEAKRLLSKPKIIMDVLHNTHKVMRKDIYLSNIAETRAILKSSKFITQNGSVPEAEILFAQDLKAMYDELDKWEEAFNNIQGDSPAQIQQLDSLFLGDHSDKLNKLMDIYGYKCLLQRYKNEALDIEAERTSGISQDIKLVRKMDVYQNAFQTLDSWKNSIDSLTEKELGQKANNLLRNVDTTIQQIGNSTAEDIISSVDSQPFQKQGDVFIAAGKFSIEATGDYYQRSLEYVFDKKSDAAPFINDVKNLTKQCLEELENMKKEAVSDGKALKNLRGNIDRLRINLNAKLGTVWNNATEHIQERYPLSAARNTFENIGWQYKENLAQILGESKAAPFVNEIQNLVTQYANQVHKMGAEPVLNDKTLAHLKAKTNDLTENLTKDLNNVRARAMDQFYKEHPYSADTPQTGSAAKGQATSLSQQKAPREEGTVFEQMGRSYGKRIKEIFGEGNPEAIPFVNEMQDLAAQSVVELNKFDEVSDTLMHTLKTELEEKLVRVYNRALKRYQALYPTSGSRSQTSSSHESTGSEYEYDEFYQDDTNLGHSQAY